jgi:predicted nucleotidyltransferase
MELPSHTDLLDKIMSNPGNKHLGWLSKGLSYVTVHGSVAYGTNTPESDIDIKGWFIPTPKYYLGFLNKIEQVQLNEPDLSFFEIKKFLKLAIEANPNVLETIFTEPEDHIFVSPIGQKLLDIKESFLSKKAFHTMQGYLWSQCHRLETHRSYLLNPPKKKPERADFGLPEELLVPAEKLKAIDACIKKEFDKHNFGFLDNLDRDQRIGIINLMEEMMIDLEIYKDDLYTRFARKIGLDDNIIQRIQKEHGYSKAVENFNNFENWKKTRNPKRAADEAKYGFDLKHGTHMVRLGVMCKELLSCGKLIVKRKIDRDFFMAIRRGEWSYDDVMEFTELNNAACKELYKTSKVVPEQPNRVAIDKFCQELIEASLSMWTPAERAM